MKPAKAVFILIVCLLVGVVVPKSAAQISAEIESLIVNSRASNAFWTVQVRDLHGQVLEDLNGDKLIRPASNLKLISSGLFFNVLGSHYTFETHIYGRGYQEDDVWRGDLIVKGAGDPSINGTFYDENPLFVFEKWISAIKDLGITEIDGDLIGFDGLFDDIPYPRGWEWDDLTFYYAPKISALSFNSNLVDLEIKADGAVGGVPEIEWFPFNTPFIEFVNEQVIRPRGTRFESSFRRMLGTNTILLRSKLPQGRTETRSLTVSNPSLYFLDTLKRCMEKEGIKVSGELFAESDYEAWSDEDLTLIDIHESEPLYKLVQWLNRESDNFFAEMLLKKIAAQELGEQGSTEDGLGLMKEYMHSMQFDTVAVSLRDASGMAPANLIKAADLNRFLLQVQSKEYYPYLFESLANGTVNGTLSHRFRNSPVRQEFFGKTGFVSGVRALSGYLNTITGRQLAVTIVTNNYTVRTAHVDFIHEQILDYLYQQY